MTTTNVSRPTGLKPSRFLKGAKWNGQSQLYAFAAAQANNAYVGDLVQFDDTNRATAITDVYAPGIPLVKPVVATLTTNAFRGVISGFVVQPEFNMTPTATLGLYYRVLSTARYVFVVDDIDVVFQAQEKGNAYVTALDNGVNKTTDITYVAGSALTGQSGVYLNTPAASGVKPLRINRYSQLPNNFGFVAADTDSFAQMDVTIANSDMAQANVGL